MARAVPVRRSCTSGSEVVQAPALASSEPPAAPEAVLTHLMFQPPCTPPASPQTPAALAVAFLTARVVPPKLASVYPSSSSPAL